MTNIKKSKIGSGQRFAVYDFAELPEKTVVEERVCDTRFEIKNEWKGYLMDRWNAYFYQWLNPFFGTYDLLGFFSEEEMPRLRNLYGDRVMTAASWPGENLKDVEFEKVRFFFVDSKNKVITPMKVLAYAFGGQYTVLPIGKREENFEFLADEYQWKEDWQEK